jgi:hypothetical protein
VEVSDSRRLGGGQGFLQPGDTLSDRPDHAYT